MVKPAIIALVMHPQGTQELHQLASYIRCSWFDGLIPCQTKSQSWRSCRSTVGSGVDCLVADWLRVFASRGLFDHANISQGRTIGHDQPRVLATAKPCFPHGSVQMPTTMVQKDPCPMASTRLDPRFVERCSGPNPHVALTSESSAMEVLSSTAPATRCG